MYRVSGPMLLSLPCILLQTTLGFATTHTVSPDGGGDFPTIQAAVDAALDGDVIELASGVFTGNGNRDVSIDSKAITVRSASGDPSLCILDCGGPTEDHRAFEIVGVIDITTVLSGFTVANGRANEGGAIYCAVGTSPVIQECVFTACEATGSGGAIFSDSTVFNDATPEIKDCVFTNNHAATAGAIACGGDWPRPTPVERCRFEFNNADEVGAVELFGGTVTDCEFTGNSATGSVGALSLAVGSVSGSVFDENSAGQDAGALLVLGTSEVLDCVFRRNTALLGGAVTVLAEESSHIDGCTFVENEATSFGGALHFKASVAVVEHCTFVDNTAPNGSLAVGEEWSILEVSYSILTGHGPGPAIETSHNTLFDVYRSDVFANPGGNGGSGWDENIEVDPLVCGELAPDSPYGLRADSPCAEGNNPYGLMGAWPVECEAVSGVDPSDLASMTDPRVYASPNPTNGPLEIRFQLPESRAGAAPARLRIVDVMGRLVWSRDVAPDGSRASAGSQAVTWDGRDLDGALVPGGRYYLQIRLGDQTAETPLSVLR